MSNYDQPLKRLGRLRPNDFIHWLCPDIQTFGDVYFEDREFEIVRRSVDLLYRIKTTNEEQFYLHLEFQGQLKEDFVLRLFEYSTLIYRTTNIPVETIVVFLENTPAIESLPTVIQNKFGSKVFSEFHFSKLILSKESWRDILKSGLPALLPLIPFCAIKEEDALEALQETENALENLEDEKLKLELETVFAVLGGYLFPNLIRKVLGENRMKDLMESVIYQDMVKDTAVKTKQDDILSILEIRFNHISDETKQKIRLVLSAETLQVLLKSAVTTHSFEEFSKLL